MRQGFLIGLAVVYLAQWLSPVSAAAMPLQIAGVLWDTNDLPVNIQQTLPNDPMLGSQPYLDRIGVKTAWNTITGGTAPIAIIDTGITVGHEDLVNKLWVNTGEIAGNNIDDDNNGYIDDYHGYNFVDRNSNLVDYHGHGTGIASIIAATTNNGRGMAGINWQAPIMVLKALNSTGGGDFASVSEALRYAADHGAKIINLSFGSTDTSSTLESAVNYALGKGATVVAAVGNNSHVGAGIFYPAAYPGVIAVSSVDASNQLSSFSNSGIGTDLTAPGEDILMAGVNGYTHYTRGAGSSFAAAEVSGVASLLLAQNPALTPTQADTILKSTATPLPGNPSGAYFGAGLVNATQAVLYRSQTLQGSYHVSNNNVAVANGADSMLVRVSIQDEFGNPKANLPVSIQATSSGILLNGSILSPGQTVSVGSSTDASGAVHFGLDAVSAGTKTIKVFSGANQINFASGPLTVTFRSVVAPRHSMQWLRQSPTVNMSLGETTVLWVELKNTGNIAWVSDATATDLKGILRLGTARPLDRQSSFYNVGTWASLNRVGYLTAPRVRPGETGRFEFTIQANQVGSFREYFRPVIEYVTWLNDLGIYWDINVTNPNNPNPSSFFNPATDLNPAHYAADIRGKSNDVTLSPGQSAGFWVDLINIGSAAWMSAGKDLQGTGSVRLGTAMQRDRTSAIYSPTWLSSNRVTNVKTMVSPNGTTALSFDITAPATPGIYQENFQLVSEYVGWFGPTFGWTVTVK